MGKRQKDIFVLTEQFFRSFMKDMIGSVKELDLPGAPQDMKVLMLIKHHPGIAISKIVDETGRDKSQITRKIKDLEERGFLVRKLHEHDKRVSTLWLTKEGQDIAVQLEATKKQVLSRILGTLSVKEQENLADILHKILIRNTDDEICT